MGAAAAVFFAGAAFALVAADLVADDFAGAALFVAAVFAAGFLAALVFLAAVALLVVALAAGLAFAAGALADLESGLFCTPDYYRETQPRNVRAQSYLLRSGALSRTCGLGRELDTPRGP